ncbi:hypothetical protein LTR53_018905, partial [Teratosphaeriaceae sp. CCFEE 6253]
LDEERLHPPHRRLLPRRPLRPLVRPRAHHLRRHGRLLYRQVHLRPLHAVDRLHLPHGSHVRVPHLSPSGEHAEQRGHHWRADGDGHEALRLLLECLRRPAAVRGSERGAEAAAHRHLARAPRLRGLRRLLSQPHDRPGLRLRRLPPLAHDLH